MAEDHLEVLRNAVRDVADFPKQGVLFKDITPILANGDLLTRAVDVFVEACEGKEIDKVVGIDARGFIFGAAVAYQLGVGFIPVRKKGKLPFTTEGVAYSLEYGEAVVEIHTDAIESGERVVIIDDLLATGGTASAAANLVRKVGGDLVAIQFLIELEFLGGRARLDQAPVVSFIRFP